MSCKSVWYPAVRNDTHQTPYAWTDITWLMHRAHVSWGFYLDQGAQSKSNPGGVPAFWNELPGFVDVREITNSATSSRTAPSPPPARPEAPLRDLDPARRQGQ